MSDVPGRRPDGGMLYAFLFAIVLVLTAQTVVLVVLARRVTDREEKRAEVQRERVSLDTQIVTAYHEAGHAVADVTGGLRPGTMYVAVERDKDDKYLGSVGWGSRIGDARDAAAIRRAEMMTYYAGNAAEQVILGKSDLGDGDDRDNADERILAVCQEHKCGKCPPGQEVEGICRMGALVGQEREAVRRETLALVTEHRKVIMLLAEELMRQPIKDGKRSMSGDAIMAFLAGHGLTIEAARTSPKDAGPPADAGPDEGIIIEPTIDPLPSDPFIPFP